MRSSATITRLGGGAPPSQRQRAEHTASASVQWTTASDFASPACGELRVAECMRFSDIPTPYRSSVLSSLENVERSFANNCARKSLTPDRPCFVHFAPGTYMVCFAATLAISIYVIQDLEYPRIGLTWVDAFDQVLEQVRASMH
jgi:hypothetical protein